MITWIESSLFSFSPEKVRNFMKLVKIKASKLKRKGAKINHKIWQLKGHMIVMINLQYNCVAHDQVKRLCMGRGLLGPVHTNAFLKPPFSVPCKRIKVFTSSLAFSQWFPPSTQDRWKRIKTSVFDRFSVDGRRKRIKKCMFSYENALVWTEP